MLTHAHSFPSPPHPARTRSRVRAGGGGGGDWAVAYPNVKSPAFSTPVLYHNLSPPPPPRRTSSVSYPHEHPVAGVALCPPASSASLVARTAFFSVPASPLFPFGATVTAMGRRCAYSNSTQYMFPFTPAGHGPNVVAFDRCLVCACVWCGPSACTRLGAGRATSQAGDGGAL